jgi:sugar phosphate isomerase/epimerase
VSWCFHSFSPGADALPAIATIGQLGFDGIDLIVLAPDDLKTWWTDTRLDRIRTELDRYKLRVAQFVLFQPVVAGLTSLNRDERNRSLDNFASGCRIGNKLGAPVLNIVAPWPRELKGPTDYLPRYYDIPQPKSGEKFHIDIASGFDWGAVWQNYIDVTKQCLERAKTHRMKVSIEHHTHTLIPDAASFLRLWDAIRDPALGYNLDTGWTLSQREYPPLAIHKIGPRLMNVHVRDIDGMMRQFPHFGEGVMDFRAIAAALKAVNYSGYLSIEQDKHPGDMKATCARYLKTMREYLG